MGLFGSLFFHLPCGTAAGLLHVCLNPTATFPAVGASGAIAGVMAAYFVLFPRARIVAMFPILIFPVFFELPAFLYLGLWFLTQFFGGALAIASPRAAGGIAFWAHVGGFLTGLLTFWIFLRRPKPRPVSDSGLL